MEFRIVDMAASDQKLYFIPHKIAAVIEYDLLKQSARTVAKLLECNVSSDICGVIQSIDGYLYIAPFRGNSFYIVDRNKIVFEKGFKCKSKLFNITRFQGKFICDKYVGFIGIGFPGIAAYERATNQLIIKEISLSQLEDMEGTFINSRKVFGTIYAIVDNRLYIPFYGTRNLFILNLENLEYEIKDSYFNCELSGICGDGSNQIWLIPMTESKLIKYDIKTESVLNEIDMPQEYRREEKQGYMHVFYHEGYMWLFPLYSNMIIKVETNTCKMICVKLLKDSNSGRYIYAGVLDEKHVGGFSCAKDYIDIIDIETHFIGHLDIHRINMSNDILDEIVSSSLCSEMVIGMNQFMQYVENNDVENNIKYLKMSIGNKIWTRLR